MNAKSCSNCLYFHEVNHKYGECRRHAPRPGCGQGWEWPAVRHDTGACGEYQPPPVQQARESCPECVRLRGIVDSLAERVAGQSEVLTARAEKGGAP